MSTILIVDENAEFLNLLAKLFEPSGFQVKGALSSSEAMKMLNGIDVLDIDLIISSAQMANGAGLELLRVVRLRGLEIPFFLLTTKNGMDEQRAIRVGATGLLDRSPEAGVVSAVIEELNKGSSKPLRPSESH